MRDVVDYVAGDFKVKEALPSANYNEIFENTVRCFKILRNTGKRITFCKIVLPDVFDFEGVVECVDAVKDFISVVVLQPVFGRENIKALMELQDRLMDVCDVRIIPQVHKYLGLR